MSFNETYDRFGDKLEYSISCSKRYEEYKEIEKNILMFSKVYSLVAQVAQVTSRKLLSPKKSCSTL
jgi:hypothetical protein